MTKALGIIKEWNPDVIPKYAMVDFDSGEILSLEKIFPSILVFLCDFHREQAWNRWVNKRTNNVFMIADDVKRRLRRIANSRTVAECSLAVNDLRTWDHFNTQLANYFNKTWYPEITKWCLAYRPDDLFRCNTNNGTERLNESLKYTELDGYKNCTLSELMGVLIDSFVPNLYERYVSLNIKYTDGYKGYSSSLPRYMVNRPGPLVDDMLRKKNKITPFMVSSVQPVLVCTSPVFAVQSVSPTSNETNMYIIKFGDRDTICSCECGSFKHDRLLCKHFFAVFESKLGDFGDISPLYINHPYTNIDWGVVGGVRVFGPEPEQQNQVIVEDQTCSSTSHNETHGFDLTASLPGRRKHRAKVAKQKLLSDLKVITEKIYNIRDYDHIMNMQAKVTEILQYANESLEMENKGELCSRVDNNSADKSALRRYDNDLCIYDKNLPMEKLNRKNPYSKMRGKKADMMKEQYIVKVPVPQESSCGETCDTNVVIDGTVDCHDDINFNFDTAMAIDENSTDEEEFDF